MPGLLSDAVSSLTEQVKALRVDVQEEARQRRRQIRWGKRLLAVIIVVGVLTVGGSYLLIRQNAHRITANSLRLEQVVYAQCVTRNQGVARQNALLDTAIAAERRKPHPNQAQIKALEQFKGAIVDCGQQP